VANPYLFNPCAPPSAHLENADHWCQHAAFIIH